MAGESTVTVKSPMFGSCVYRSRETRVNNRRGNRDKSRPIFNDNEISFIHLIIKWILKLEISTSKHIIDLFSRTWGEIFPYTND